MPPIPKRKIKELTKKELLHFFTWFDSRLSARDLSASYIILGGAALVLLDIIARSTVDLDLPAQEMSQLINEAGNEFGIEIDIVTQCTTVDFTECPKKMVFAGDALKIFSIQTPDLLKSKLERFQKQDPQDINAIILHDKLSYTKFKQIFSEMTKFWVGHPDRLKMHARTVVEWNYPNDIADFYSAFKLSHE
jgi:uncharacterized nucleotidyltransferase DUF6036